MDALNHADQMRLASLINDNSDDAEIQKKLDQVVELTSSTRDQAAVALHDCHYDVEKAVDMILENGHAIVETQWKSAGKRKNKNNTSSQAKLSAQAQSGSHHQQQNPTGSGKNQYNKQSTNNHATSSNSGAPSGSGTHSGAMGRGSHQAPTHHHHQKWTENQQHTSNKNTNQQASSTATPSNQQFNSSNINNNINNHNNNNNNTINSKQDASDGLKNIVDISSSNLMYTSDSTSTANPNPTKTSSLPQQQQIQRSVVHQITNRQQQHQQQIHPRSTRIPDSAVEMPSELQVSSLNVQFGELDLREGTVDANDAKGAFQDVLESSRLERQAGLPNSHSAVSSHDSKGSRHISQQQQIGRGGPRRQYNHNNNNPNNNNTNDDRRFYNNPNRGGGRQISGDRRPHNPRLGPMNNNNNSNNPRVRTIMSRGPQPNPTSLTTNNSNQATGGFPNSIDTWTNSTAEAATKTTNVSDQMNVAGTLRVGQWSDVTGNEDWSEEDWDAKVMETKVFTPSTKPVDGTPSAQKSQPLLTDSTGVVASQINLAAKLPETVRDDLSAQQNTLNAISPQGQSQQTSQKSISHMNDIFDASVAKVLEQQNFAAIKPKTSTIGMSQFQTNKDHPSDAKNVLDQQNLSSIKPKTSISMNQYNKEASESLKTLVGIATSKGGVPSVPPGALPLMSQPQYIMGNAYQPAIFPYAYQTPDVHYQVAAQNAGRDQNFQSVYSPNDASKFNRGTDGDQPTSITTTQAAPVASQTPNQAFVTNALHAGYPLTYAMPGTFNMMPQNLYSAAPIFPHIPQPTNTGSANNVYQKNTAASYQHHTGYSGYDHPLIQDYVKQQQHQNYSSSAVASIHQQQQQQQQQPTSKSSGLNSELDVSSGANSYNMYASVNKNQQQANKQTANYNDNTKGYQQQQMSGNGPQQQFGFSQHNPHQQPGSIAGYPLLQSHGLDNSGLNNQGGSQQQQMQQQHNSSQRGGNQVNPSKYYPNWN